MHKIPDDENGFKLIFAQHCSSITKWGHVQKNLLFSLNTGEERVDFVFVALKFMKKHSYAVFNIISKNKVRHKHWIWIYIEFLDLIL